MSDTISRRMAMDAFEERLDYLQMFNKDENLKAESKGVNWARITIAALPSAQPERKRGEWVPYLPEGLRYKCSECESRYETPWHFCPNCGADMRGIEHDESRSC